MVPSVVKGDVLISAVEVFLVIGVGQAVGGQAVGGGQVGQETVGQESGHEGVAVEEAADKNFILQIMLTFVSLLMLNILEFSSSYASH